MIYKLVGPPIPLKRPRFSKRGQVYDSQSAEREDSRLQLRLQHKCKPKYYGPLELEITFFMKIPKSTPKKLKLDQQPHIKKPDLDNLIKWVLDCSTNILYHDDSIVYHVTAVKLYDTIPRTEFTITEIDIEHEKEANEEETS